MKSKKGPLYLFLFLSILLNTNSNAKSVKSIELPKELTRTSFLGLIPQSVETGEPVVVNDLHPQGTAINLGLLVGDQLITINGQTINDFPSLLPILNNIDEGQLISVAVLRDDKPIKLKAIAQSRPLEKGKEYTVNYDSFTWQKERIRTITYHPNNPRKDGASVFFIQGYTCDSIDYGMIPDISLTQLLSSYAQAGFTVMKMEKPGVGDSRGQLDCYQYDFTLENQAFLAGLNHFKQQPAINAEKVFVFGHSLGVLHAAVIAEKGLAKGVIGYGGVLKSWYDYLIDIYAKQSVNYWGVSKEQAKKNVALIKPFLNQWLNTKDNWQSIASSQTTKAVLDAALLPINDDQVFNRHFSFFRNLNRYDFTQLWSNTQSHVLTLHGEYDIQAIDGKWAVDIVKLTAKNNEIKSESLSFLRTDHSLMQFKNTEDLMKVTRRQARELGHFNKNIAIKTLEWIESVQ